METGLSCRYFISYTGVKLPLQLVNELDADRLENRITYFKAYYDGQGRVKIIEKLVYGEIEFVHHYEYDQDDALQKAILLEGEELPRTMVFDKQGQSLESSPQNV